MAAARRGHLVWLLGAAALGFLLPAAFAGALGLPRNLYLVPYVGLVLVFLAAYARWAAVPPIETVRRRWARGAAGALVVGAVMLRHVRSQPPSASPEGFGLVFALVWPGLVYGVVDGLFLSVMPVVAARRMAGADGRLGRVRTAAAALLASALVTAAYHLGYPEFRGAAVLGPVAGNSALTAAYLLTGSPVAAVGGHVIMHVAAVLHGIDTTVQLPPHAGGPEGRREPARFTAGR
ncbi:MAG TPA: hypothetical protein VF406_02340 [Thermodesulfobacteriota bacterium]